MTTALHMYVSMLDQRCHLEHGVAEQRLEAKCQETSMSRHEVLAAWGDPALWEDDAPPATPVLPPSAP